MKVRLTHRGQIDMFELLRYTATELSVDAAKRLNEKLFRRFDRIGQNPQVGEKVSLPSGDLHRSVVEPYVIYYLVTDRAVEIVRILHGARDHGPLLEE